ncbi:hypothetical protein GCM10009687_06150 [Asanoa iriomotensis]|uniref:Uncharacterized protein n=1 Tax=Asanoa iriomotensis TaxID=234613 RepID=A0ABQ4C2L1_9ACTN|nr:hypothetical protein Air01nite_27610 [Asanoa iriomotensis]
MRTGVAEALLILPAEPSDTHLVERREYYRSGRGGSGYRLVPGEAAGGRGLEVTTSPDGCMLSVSLE